MDLESLHKIIKHPIRRKIMLTLLQKQEVAYIDLMNILEIENTGKFNYHLKILGDLIEKNTDGKYRLTEKGQLASQLLLRFPEKKSERMPLHGGDAILIGFAGFLIALANPGFWFFYLITILGVGILYLGLVYGLMVPGGVMWFLTARRTNSHDPYDLFKPPLASFTLFILLLIFMRFLNISITISVPYQDSSSLAITQP
ncbi:MAG: winged helix-turn-helix domain-containing protein, partial [Candidatus Bathyarchaeia archaeon]